MGHVTKCSPANLHYILEQLTQTTGLLCWIGVDVRPHRRWPMLDDKQHDNTSNSSIIIVAIAI